MQNTYNQNVVYGNTLSKQILQRPDGGDESGYNPIMDQGKRLYH